VYPIFPFPATNVHHELSFRSVIFNLKKPTSLKITFIYLGQTILKIFRCEIINNINTRRLLLFSCKIITTKWFVNNEANICNVMPKIQLFDFISSVCIEYKNSIKINKHKYKLSLKET